MLFIEDATKSVVIVAHGQGGGVFFERAGWEVSTSALISSAAHIVQTNADVGSLPTAARGVSRMMAQSTHLCNQSRVSLCD